MKERRNPRARQLSFLLPLTLAILLGLYRIEIPEPHADVHAVLGVFSPTWTDLALDFLTAEGIYGGSYPPLYFMIAKAYGGIVGTDLVSLRVLSVIAFVALVAVSWWGFPLLATNTNAALRLWFVLAVATAPAHLWWAQTAKYTMFLYLAYAVATLAAIRFLDERSTGSAALMAVSFFGLFLTHYVSFFFIAATVLSLTLIALWIGDRGLLRTLIRYSTCAALVTLPFLPAVIQSLIWQSGGYHADFDESMSPSNLLRAAIMKWNFGTSLLPQGGGLAQLNDSLSLVADGNAAEAMKTFAYISPAVAAILLLTFSFAHAGVQAYRHPEARFRAFLLLAVLVLSLSLSATKGLANRFVYLGFGTWFTQAFLAVGWGASRNLRGPLVLGSGILALNALSLASYYSHLDLKYPGARLVVEYLREHAGEADRVLVDSWIVDIRGTPLPEEKLPGGLSVQVVDSESAILHAEGKVTLAFLAGTRESVEEKLDRHRALGVRWKHVHSFDSMEMRERSLHLYRFER